MSLDRTPAQLADMLGFVRELRAIVTSRPLEAFVGDRILNLATEKLFINLGEAAQRVPEAERLTIGGVPWRQIIGLRNILAHGYERIDRDAVPHPPVRLAGGRDSAGHGPGPEWTGLARCIAGPSAAAPAAMPPARLKAHHKL